MPLPTNKIFKLLNKKEDILSTILEEIRQGKKVYSLPEHTFMQEQVDYTQFPIRGEFATMENEEGRKKHLILFPQYYSRTYTGIYSEYCFAKNQNLSMVL